MPRLFTLSQAGLMLPFVARVLRHAIGAQEEHDEATRLLHGLGQRILLMGGISVNTTQVENWKIQLSSSGERLQSSLGKLEDAGVLVKDLKTGLVDFPTMFRGEEVYLCGRLGEGKIDYWHGVHEGFAGRREINKDFIDNHHGGELA